MQEYDDFKLPDENSLAKLNSSYSQDLKVSSLKTDKREDKDNEMLSQIFNSINWDRVTDLLKLLQNKSETRISKQFVRGLIPLNEQDFGELNEFYKNKNLPRNNPSLLDVIPTSYNSTLREYIKSEIMLLHKLVDILYNENEPSRAIAIYNILSRRFEALNTLVNFFNFGFF